MTQDEIIAMAREAAARHGHTLKAVPSLETTEFILELVSMAAAKEREAIKALCLELGGTTDFDQSTCLNLADEISARRDA